MAILAIGAGTSSSVYAQANANTIIQVNAGNNNVPIVEIEYEVMRPAGAGGPYTWLQTASGQEPPSNHTDGDPLPVDVPVNIVRVEGPDGLELFPEPRFPTTTNFHPRVASTSYPPSEWAVASEIQIYTPTLGISHRIGDNPNPNYFTEIGNVISVPDMRSYWDLGRHALGDATQANPQSFMDVIYENPILPGDIILISERHGNTPMSFTPLDASGNVIMDGATVSVVSPDAYQWNTLIANVPDNSSPGQRQWLIMVDASLFYNNNPHLPLVHGWRVNMTTTDGGDGKILLFKRDGTITGRISIDTTGDATGNVGHADVTVALLDEQGNPVLDENDNPVVTVTDGNGIYKFIGLDPGLYQIAQTVPAGFVAVNDVDGGDLSVIGDVDLVELLQGENVEGMDFVNQQPTSIGDRVWQDLNADGIQDDGEPGFAGVLVNLLDASDAVIDTTTTDAQGLYLFDDLPPGTYLVEVVAPAGYVFSPQYADGQGISGPNNSDADPATGRTAPLVLTGGDGVTYVDAGLYIEHPVTVGGFVWSDANMNGIQDTGEIGVPGVTIELYDIDDNVVASTVSDGSGLYTIGNLLQGFYYLSVAPLPDWTLSPQMVGDDPTRWSLIDPATERSPVLLLEAGETYTEFDVGMFAPANDVGVAKSVNLAAANVGDLVTFTIVATNVGPYVAEMLYIDEALPEGLLYESSSASQGSYDPGTGQWAIGTLAIGGSATLTVAAEIGPGTSTQTLVNAATIYSLHRPDTNTVNNVDSASVYVFGADVQIDKTVDDGFPAELDVVTFIVSLTNAGPDTATQIEVQDLLPTGLTFVSATASTGTYNAVTGLWAVPALPTYETAELSVEAQVAAGTGGTTITNVATVVALDQEVPSTETPSAEAAVLVQGADLALQKTVDNASPTEGSVIRYTLTVVNNGPFPASGIEVVEPLANGLIYADSTPTQGTYNQGAGLWYVGSLGVGESASLVVEVEIDEGLAGTFITNTSAIVASSLPDPNAGNTSDSAVISVAKLVVTKTSDAVNPLLPGDTITYSIVVTNVGASAQTGLSVLDAIPLGTTYVPDSLMMSVIGDTNELDGGVCMDVEVARVQFAQADAANAPTATFGSAPTQGNVLVAASFHRVDGHTPSISGSGWLGPITDFYAIANGQHGSPDNNTRRGMAIWYKIAGDNEPASITTSWSPATENRLLVQEFSVTNGEFNIADVVSSVNNSGGNLVTSLGSGSTGVIPENTDDNALLIGFIGSRDAINGITSWTDGLGGSAGGSTGWGNQRALWSGFGLADDEPDTRSSTATWSSSRRASAVLLGVGITCGPPPPSVEVVYDSTAMFTAPPGVTSIVVEAWGGGGGPRNDGSDQRGGGGGGAYASSTIAVTPLQTYDVVVGQGGAALHSGAEGHAGGASFFDSGAEVFAQGGLGGVGVVGGAGGSIAGSVGEFRAAGGDGGAAGSQWSFQREICVDHQLISAPLANFPLKIELTASNFDFTKAAADGSDIRFRDETGVIDLVFERERHDASAQSAVYWVLLPQVAANEATCITMLYGYAEASDVADTTGAVWDEHYVAVWHMGDNPGGSAPQMIDFTGNNNHGTALGGVTSVEGYIGPSVQLNGSDGHVRVPNSSSLNMTGNQFTLEAWVRPTNIAGDGDAGIISKAHETDANVERYHLGIDRNGGINVRRFSGSLARLDTAAGTVSNNSWQHIVGRYDGSTLRAFRNGVQVGSMNTSGNLTGSTRDLVLGKRYDSRHYTGRFDELRISNIARSDAWLLASYHSSAGSLVSFGSEIGAEGQGGGGGGGGSGGLEGDGEPGGAGIGFLGGAGGVGEGVGGAAGDSGEPGQPGQAPGGGGGARGAGGGAGGDGADGRMIIRYFLPVGHAPELGEPPELISGFYLLPGQAMELTFQVTVDDPALYSAITNVVHVESDQEIAPVSATHIDPVAVADLSLTKTANLSVADAGDPVTYEIQVFNAGPQGATGIVISEPLAAGLEFNNASATHGTYDPGTGLWQIDSLALGATATLTITADIGVDQVGNVIMNTATILAVDQRDPDPSDDSDTADVIVRGADIGVAMTVDDETPVVESDVVFTVTVENAGPSATTELEVLDLLPAGLSYVGSTTSQGGYNAGTGIWNVGILEPEGTATLTLTATVLESAEGTQITNTASVYHVVPVDPNPDNNSAAVVLSPRASGEISISKESDGGESVLPNQVLTYTITVINHSPYRHQNLVINDPIPAGVTYEADSSSIGYTIFEASAVDSFQSPSYNLNDGALAWSGPWQETGETTSPTDGRMRIVFDPTGAQGYALVMQGGEATRAIHRTVDLSGATHATLSLKYRRQSFGEDGAVRIQVTDAGAEGPWIDLDTISGAGSDPEYQSLHFDISDWQGEQTGIRFLMDQPMSNSEYLWIDDVEIAVSGAVQVQIPAEPAPLWINDFTLEPNALLTLTFAVRVDESPAVNDIVNIASVVSDRQPVPLYAEVSDQIARADLGLSMIASEPIPVVEEPFDFIITVANAGPFSGSGIVVENVLPPGLTFVSAQASMGTYQAGTGHWTIPTVSVATPVTLTITVMPEAAAAGLQLTNRATLVALDQIDLNTANHAAEAAVHVAPPLEIVDIGFAMGGLGGVQIAHRHVPGNEYDLIYVDAPSYDQTKGKAWGLAHRSSEAILMDLGSEDRVAPQDLPVNVMRFYRVSAPGLWENPQRPRRASVEIGLAHRVELRRRQNWVAYPASHYCVKVSSIFGNGQQNELPSGITPTESVTVTWYHRTTSETPLQQMWLDSQGDWRLTTEGTPLANGMDVSLAEGVVIELPSSAPEGSYSISFVGAVPTEAQEQAMMPHNAFNLSSFRLPLYMHPSQMNLLESGFKAGSIAGPTWYGEIETSDLGNYIWALRRDVQEITRFIYYNDAIAWGVTPGWYYTDGPNWYGSAIPASARPFGPNDGIVIRTSGSIQPWTWTNVIPYNLPTQYLE